MSSQVQEPEWTRCTDRCAHRGPYRVHCRSGETWLVTNKGCASASYALSDPVIVSHVTAPHEAGGSGVMQK